MNEPTTEAVRSVKREDFVMKDCALIAVATGKRALTLRELRDLLGSVTPDSIYYHFWGGLLQPRFEEREYNNDFAAWAWYSLHDAVLAERLAVVDPTDSEDMEELRLQLVEIMEERLDEKETLSWITSGVPFEFIRSQIVIFDTGKRAGSPQELARQLRDISPSSIFYHFIDSRRRLTQHADDFSSWLSSFASQESCQAICEELRDIDPYFVSLVQLKEELVQLFQRYFNGEVL